MKSSNLLLCLVASSIVFMNSCREDNAYPVDVSNSDAEITPRTNYYLINTIGVTLNGQGLWEFVDDLETVADQVDVIFVDNSDFNQVDEFGFDTTASGTQFFYAVEYDVNGARSWTCYLDPSTGAISTTYGGSQVATGRNCIAEECCDKCVDHSSLGCICHDITDSCMTQNPPPTGKCKDGGTSNKA